MIRGVRGVRAFARFREEGTRRSNATVAVVAVSDAETSVAFAIGRRIGNAVERNRLRRRLRALLVSYDAVVFPPGQYLVIPSPAAIDRTHAELDEALRDVLAQFR